MKRPSKRIVLAGTILGLLVVFFLGFQILHKQNLQYGFLRFLSNSDLSGTSGKNKSHTDYENQITRDNLMFQIIRSQKPAAILITAKWAPDFKMDVESAILKAPEIARLKNRFSFIKIDVTTIDESNDAILKWLGVTSVPALIFTNENGFALPPYRFYRSLTVDQFYNSLKYLLFKSQH